MNKICEWCGMPVGDRQSDYDGNHRDFFSGCKPALQGRLKELTHELAEEVQKSARLEAENTALRNELIEERALVAYQTERLEICRSCPHEKDTLLDE